MHDSLPLSDQQLDRLADLLAARLVRSQAPPPSMLTVDDVCAQYKVSRAWVYENAGRLGGVKLSTARHAPLRFDRKRVEDALPRVSCNDLPAQHPRPTRERKKNLLPVYDG